MEKTLSELYASMYRAPVVENAETPTQTVVEEAEDKKIKAKKKEKKSEEVDPGILGDSTSFQSVFGDIMKTLNEDFGESAADDTFDYEGGEEGFEGEDEQISVSKSTIQSIIDQLQGLIGDIGYDDNLEGDEFAGEGDDIPLESYGFDGGGAHHGAASVRDGKAGLLPKTDLVTPDGDSKKEKAKVPSRPTKGHNGLGASNGASKVRNGQASKLSPSTLVKGNGDADFGKNKTGYGRAKGEDQF